MVFAESVRLHEFTAPGDEIEDPDVRRKIEKHPNNSGNQTETQNQNDQTKRAKKEGNILEFCSGGLFG